LDKAEGLTKKFHKEIFGKELNLPQKIRRRKVPSNKKVNFTKNTYYE